MTLVEAELSPTKRAAIDLLADGKRAEAPITFVCWKWRQVNFRTVYTAEHVNTWAAMLRRHYRKPHRAICITDDPEGITECDTHQIWSDLADLSNPSGPHLPRCYRRLKIFSQLVTAELDVDLGELVMSTDLDIVIVADIVPIVHKYPEASFVGWRGVGAHNPCVYNGSLFRFRAGTVDFLWNEFDPQTSPREAIAHKYFGSDQSWLSYRLRGAAPGWNQTDGV